MQGKNILGLHKTCNGMFRGGTAGGEKEGPRSSGEEQAWENGGIRRWKALVACKQIAGQCTCLAMPWARFSDF